MLVWALPAKSSISHMSSTVSWEMLQDVKVDRVGPEVFKNVPRSVGGNRVRAIPPAANLFLGLFLFSVEGGSPRLLFLLGWHSKSVKSELRADGSGYVIPNATDSSQHAEGVDPFLIGFL